MGYGHAVMDTPCGREGSEGAKGSQGSEGVVGGSIYEGACASGAEGRMSSIGPSALGAKGCVRSAQGAKALVGALKLLKAPVCIKPSQPP